MENEKGFKSPNETFQDYINKKCKNARDQVLANSDQLTLGKLIALLEPLLPEKADSNVIYDFGYFKPTTIDSWRGAYDELALDYKENCDGFKLDAFVLLLKECIGKTFEGYKGGEFIMNENTPIWVANYSESGNTAVIGIIDNGYQIILSTGYREF